MSFFDSVERQLREATVAQARGSHATVSGWRGARPRRLGLLVAGAVLLVGSGTATAVTLLSNAPDDPDDPVPTSPTVTARPGTVHPLSRAQRKALQERADANAPMLDAGRWFAVLKRPPTTADRPPGMESVRGARLAAGTPQGRVYIRATARRTCVIFLQGTHGPAGATGTCAPTRSARQRGVAVVLQCLKSGPPQRRIFAGVAPDGITTVTALRAGALQASTPVQRNGGVIDTPQPIDELRAGPVPTPLPPVSC